jgi:alpha-tubulin suppressor-like RCC1 family protein
MKITRRQALKSDRGFMTVFGLGVMSIIMVFAIGVVMVNFQNQSTLVSQTKNMTAAVASRANAYAASMNESMTNDTAIPSLAYEWDARTFLSTTITGVVNKPNGTKALTISAQSESGRFKISRTVTIAPTKVSHVTGFDEVGSPIWALAAGATPYTLWGFTAGSIRPLTLAEESGPAAGASEWCATTHHMGLDNAGKLWAWGANGSGQVGNGTTTTANAPINITPASTYRTIVADSTSSFAIDTRGALWAWGDNGSDVLGLNSNKSVPTRSPLNQPIQTVTVGSSQAYAIDSRGRLWGWGLNTGQRLGVQSSLTTVREPLQVSPGQTFRSVNTDGGSTYAIDTAGQLWAWGFNGDGQLGVGYSSAPITIPTAIASSVDFASVDTIGGSAVAISTAGRLYAWGESGRAGNGSTGYTKTPQLANTTDIFTVVAAGETTSYALNSSGALFAWGDNSSGQFGDGTTTSSNSPRQVLTGSTFVALSADNVTSAVDSRGGLWTFGRAGAGLWPITFTSAPNTALKMPFPSGFAPNGWK